MSDLSDEAIRAYAANIFDLEDAREVTQSDLKDAWAHIREAHGKKFADSLKLAVKRARQDADKRAAADEVDAEAERIMAILSAPRATHAIARIVPHDPETGEVVESQAKASEDNAITDDGRAADTDGPGDASRLSASGGTGAPIRRMSMTPLEPCEANGLKGFGFTVRFDEPEAAMLPQTGGVTLVANKGIDTIDTLPNSHAAEVSAPFTQGGAPTSSAGTEGEADRQPITDRTKPNPWCLDPDECGITSWTHFCLRCQRVKAEVESAAAA